jgi:hypothetical protein
VKIVPFANGNDVLRWNGPACCCPAAIEAAPEALKSEEYAMTEHDVEPRHGPVGQIAQLGALGEMQKIVE